MFQVGQGQSDIFQPTVGIPEAVSLFAILDPDQLPDPRSQDSSTGCALLDIDNNNNHLGSPLIRALPTLRHIPSQDFKRLTLCPPNFSPSPVRHSTPPNRHSTQDGRLRPKLPLLPAFLTHGNRADPLPPARTRRKLQRAQPASHASSRRALFSPGKRQEVHHNPFRRGIPFYSAVSFAERIARRSRTWPRVAAVPRQFIVVSSATECACDQPT